MEDTENGTSSLECDPTGSNEANQNTNAVPATRPVSSEKETESGIASLKNAVSSNSGTNDEIEWRVVDDDSSMTGQSGDGTHLNALTISEDAQAAISALQETSRAITDAFNRDYLAI